MSSRLRSLPLIALMLAIAAIYTVMSLWTPVQNDDWMFITRYYMFSGSSEEFNFDAWLSFMDYVRNADNSRIANMIAPFSTIFEPWNVIFPYISGAMMALMIYMASKVTGCRLRNLLVPSAAWAMCIVFLPWRSYIFTADYLLNYVYASVVLLVFIYMTVVRPDKLSRPWGLAAGIVIAILAGAWHEGLADPVGCGIAVVFIIRRFRIPWQVWVTVGVFAAVCLWTTLCQGILDRADKEWAYSTGDWFETGAWYVSQLPFALLIVSCIVKAIFRRTRHVVTAALRNPLVVITLVDAVVTLVIAHIVIFQSRIFFFSSLLCVVALIILYHPYIERIMASKRRTAILAAGLTALCVAQSAYALVWQKRVFDQHNEIIELIAASPDGCITYDYYDVCDIPIATMRFGRPIDWGESPFMMHLACIMGFDSITVTKPAALTPELKLGR